jgi:hypothetical protein
MSSVWKVTYVLAWPAKVASPIRGYPTLKVEFVYDADGNLTSLVHEVEVGDLASAHDVQGESEARLRVLWAALNYRSGVHPSIRARTAQQITQTGSFAGVAQGASRLAVIATLVRPIVFPSERAVTDSLSMVGPYLDFVNGARDATDPAQALRDYYKVLEALNLSGEQVDNVRYARNFVSRAKIDDSNVLTFLRGEGVEATRYDPGNAEHRALVRKWRSVARTLAESEIEVLLE